MSTRDKLLLEIEAETADHLAARAGDQVETRRRPRLIVRKHLVRFLLPLTLFTTAFTTGLISPRPRQALAACTKPNFTKSDHWKWCSLTLGYHYHYQYSTSTTNYPYVKICYHFKFDVAGPCGGIHYNVGTAKTCNNFRL
jgi:hypothetical protein